MTLGMKRLFGEDCEVKKELLSATVTEPNKEPMSKHIGAGHKIIEGPKILHVPTYHICQTCCVEVIPDDDSECGALMF